MLHKRFTVLGTVSALAFMAVSSVTGATAPPSMNLGVLKPHGQWKIGTVNAKGASYCAMVSQFDKDVTLAFARSGDGLGSLAMDFEERFFEAGMEYEAILKPEGGAPRRLTARASNTRSLVVQIGKDEKLFQTLSDEGDVSVSLPTIEMTFALRRFSSAYGALVECSNKFSPDAAKAESAAADGSHATEEIEQTPVEAAAQSLSGMTAKVDDRGGASKTGVEVASKKNGLSDLEKQLDREAQAEAQKSGAKLAELDKKVAELQKQVDDKKSEHAALNVQNVAVVPAVPPTQVAALEKERGDIQKNLQNTLAAKSTTKTQDAMKSSEMAANLNRKATEIEALEKKLREADAQRQAEADRAVKALAELEKARGQIAEMKSGLGGEQRRISDLQSSLKQQKDELDKKQVAFAEQEKKFKALTDEAVAAKTGKDTLVKKNAELEAKLAEMKSGIGSNQQKVADLQASLNKQKAELESKTAALAEKEQAIRLTKGEAAEAKGGKDALFKKNAELEARVAELDAQSKETTSLKARMAEEHAALEQARQRIHQLEKDVQLSDARVKQMPTMAQVTSAAAIQPSAGKASDADEEIIWSDSAELKAEDKKIEPKPTLAVAQKPTVVATIQKATAKPNVEQAKPVVEQKAVTTASSSVVKKQEKNLPIEKPVSLAKASMPAAPKKAEVAAHKSDTKKAVPVDVAFTSGMPLGASPELTLSSREKAGSEQKGIDKTSHKYIVPSKGGVVAAKAVVPQTVTAIEPAAGDATGAIGGQPSAAAFLDKIMTYHNNGKVVNKPVKMAPPALAGAATMKSPAMATPAPTVGKKMPMPVAVQQMPLDAPTAAKTKTASQAALGDIPTAVPSLGENKRVLLSDGLNVPPPAKAVTAKAGTPPPSNVDVSAFARAQNSATSSEDSDVDAILWGGTHQAQEPAAQKPAVATAAPMPAKTASAHKLNLEGLLQKGGVVSAQFVPVDAANGEVVKQWTVGTISGMYEQLSATGTFASAVQGYIDRYRDDCPGKLSVNTAPVSASSAGETSVANIACRIDGNTYASSFVFLRDQEGFKAVVHSATLEDAVKVKSYAEGIAMALRSSAGLQEASPAAAEVPAIAAKVSGNFDARQTGAVADIPSVKHLLSDAAKPAPSPANGKDEFETVVVE